MIVNVEQLLQSVGYAGIFLSVFIESGIVLGLVLPLPGFSLLFTAGVFAASGRLSLPIVIAVGLAAAISGYMAGYYSGKTYGRKLFLSPRVKQLKPEHIDQAERFYARHGYMTLVAGRFIPFIHTIAPIIAGLTRMKLLPFILLNIIGGLIWTVTATMLGFYIGQTIPNAEYYVLGLAVVIAVAINLPPVKKLLEKLADRVRSF